MNFFNKLFTKKTIAINAQPSSIQRKAKQIAISLQRSENATALDSGVVSLRLFYNAFGQAFYTVGYHTEYFFIRLKRVIICGIYKGIGRAKHIAERFLSLSISLGKILITDFTEPARRIKQHFAKISHEIDEEYEKASYKDITVRSLRYTLAAIISVFHIIVPLFGYLLPIGAACIFAFVVNSFSEYNFGLRVQVNGENLGLVENEIIYEEAQAQVRERIRSVKDGEEWSVTPEFNLAVVSKSTMRSAHQLADGMVQASSDEIKNATGILVDGELLGVTIDGASLKATLEEMKAPYIEPDNANLTVGFVKDVELVEGVYFTSSITEAQPIINTLTGQVEGRKIYSVAKGDSPSGISSRVGIPLKDLYSLNPQIDPSVTSNVRMHVGDELLISNAVDYLQIKTVERVKREIPIEHQVNSTKSDKLAWGFQKITQQGEDGIEERVLDVTRIGGIIVNENIIESRIVKEPITQEVTVGVKLANGGIAGDASTGVMQWPVPSHKGVSRGFESDRGLDIRANYGAAIVAADNGVVTFAGAGRGSYWSYGNFVTIQHSTGIVTLYAHMRNVAVSSGSYVKKGDVIGYIGLTGRTSGPHLHFETQVGGRAVDPYRFVKQG